jgi:hypothetical protein
MGGVILGSARTISIRKNNKVDPSSSYPSSLHAPREQQSNSHCHDDRYAMAYAFR